MNVRTCPLLRPTAALPALLCGALTAALPAVTSAQSCVHPPDNGTVDLLGDLDGSGSVNVLDALCSAITTLIGVSPPPSCLNSPVIVADVNCDESYDVVDMNLTLHLALGLGVPSAIDADADGCPNACYDSASPPAPVIDSGFTVLTSGPDADVDLFVSRQQTHAGPTDLSAWGLGTRDYVQSINIAGAGVPAAGSNGSLVYDVTFTGVGPQFEVIAVLTYSNPTAATALGWAIDGDNIEPCANTAFIPPASCGAIGDTGDSLPIIESDRVQGQLRFGGAACAPGACDNLRILVDYGDEFTPGAAMQITITDNVDIDGVLSSPGLVVGASQGDALQPNGTGDWGEVTTATVPLVF